MTETTARRAPQPTDFTTPDDAANQTALTTFAQLDPQAIALLLDVDGTLIDIGPSPFEVDVPDALKDALLRLYELTGGALAFVSGRPIRDLDTLFAPLVMPAVGGHGAEVRRGRDASVVRIGDLPAALRERLIAAVLPGSDIEYEDKGYSVALHYRKAQQHEDRLRDHVAAAQLAFPDEATEVLPGKMMFELKRPGIDKGGGVRALMMEKPFSGRVPVFIGDDVTDDAAFAALPALGGRAFSVNRRFDGLSGVFSAPSQVRLALQRLAAAN